MANTLSSAACHATADESAASPCEADSYPGLFCWSTPYVPIAFSWVLAFVFTLLDQNLPMT